MMVGLVEYTTKSRSLSPVDIAVAPLRAEIEELREEIGQLRHRIEALEAHPEQTGQTVRLGDVEVDTVRMTVTVAGRQTYPDGHERRYRPAVQALATMMRTPGRLWKKSQLALRVGLHPDSMPVAVSWARKLIATSEQVRIPSGHETGAHYCIELKIG
jgi:hypothetical protein